FWTVHDALHEYSANEIRAFLISTQYSKPQAFDDSSLEEGRRRFERLENALENCEEAMDSHDARAKIEDDDLRTAVEEARAGFEEAMDDDFNTPEALAALFELANAVNSHTEKDEYDYQGLFRAW
ncbi:MAG: DALR domain-containing protein, partial [Halobacteria archaeon]|nr:DALR domain-containing protein [Halobacteria archaeon]